MTQSHILIVEDDKPLADVLNYNLTQAGYRVTSCRDGKVALAEAEAHQPDLVLLDLMLPGLDGLAVCRELRANAMTRNILIVMLTAKTEESDQIVGLSAGADDYVGKPFSVRLLLERIKSHLERRDTGRVDHDVVSSQGVLVDCRSHRVVAGEHVLDLTPSEFGLLEVFVRQPGRAFTRKELIETALGGDAIVLERTIDVHVRALRQKLGIFADVVQTVRGVGYRLRDPRHEG